ncbi:MAG: hypothetical protein D6681_19280 [Calditrichaeota bacterium]|nr:MAG: hypothetical protein D6681_19280 [Calditrichota bacterium]
MSAPKILALSIVVAFAGYVVYLLTGSNEIGSFEKVRAGGEINQTVKVFVDRSQGFEKDRNGRIVAFYVRDRNGARAKVSPKEPVPASVLGAEVVELFGHMHGNNFVAVRVSAVE